MKNLSLKWLLVPLVLITLGASSVWAGESTYTMKTSGSSSTTVETNWTASTATEDFDSYGARWLCDATSKTFTITGSASITGTITKVQVTGRRNKNKAYTIDCTVGGAALGSQYSHAASSGDYDTDDTFYNSKGLTGTIVITAVCSGGTSSSAKGSFWFTSVTVTTSSGAVKTLV